MILVAISLRVSNLKHDDLCDMQLLAGEDVDSQSDLKATSHTRLRARVHYTSSTLIGWKGELVQVRFTLRLRNQRTIWMQGGYKVHMDSLHGTKWIMFQDDLDYFQKTPLGGKASHRTGRPWHSELTTTDLLYFIMCEDPAWIEIHWNSIWLRARSRMTSHYTWGSVTTLHDFGGVLGRPLDNFISGSHDFMVIALGSCVKWP
jgi:hypothetical protein